MRKYNHVLPMISNSGKPTQQKILILQESKTIFYLSVFKYPRTTGKLSSVTTSNSLCDVTLLSIKIQQRIVCLRNARLQCGPRQAPEHGWDETGLDRREPPTHVSSAVSALCDRPRKTEENHVHLSNFSRRNVILQRRYPGNQLFSVEGRPSSTNPSAL